MKPKISIIMPSLNVAAYMAECMESVINQNLKEIEIICIDAGSTDGTCEILKKYANVDDRIKLLSSTRKSYGYQINQGIRHAQGEYIQIVETDDWIEQDMSAVLYRLAKEHNLDFVKADFDSFITIQENGKLFQPIHLLDREPDLYEKVINPSHIPYLYADDYNVWKGIYKKEFLAVNNIWMNESKGAAYQDIGFSDQVLACAKRAWYTRQSFYRYRIDREESSIHSVHGLEYSCNEFRRELEMLEIRGKLKYMQGIYSHMLQSFLGEWNKTIRAVAYDLESEYVKPYMKWFYETIDLQAINNSMEEQKTEYRKLFSNPEQYVASLIRKEEQERLREQEIVTFMGRGPVIVFGAGIRGTAALRFLHRNKIEVKAVCDNNVSLWETKKAGIPIMEPEKCKSMFGDAVYLVANREHGKDIEQQLLQMGIEKERILVWKKGESACMNRAGEKKDL